MRGDNTQTRREMVTKVGVAALVGGLGVTATQSASGDQSNNNAPEDRPNPECTVISEEGKENRVPKHGCEHHREPGRHPEKQPGKPIHCPSCGRKPIREEPIKDT